MPPRRVARSRLPHFTDAEVGALHAFLPRMGSTNPAHPAHPAH